MRIIRSGDRGPAVEDVQRRLLSLGYELGRTGVDGVFLGRTCEAVKAFQLSLGLAEDGLVGEETWSALVDATFTLGDRMLYLRMPHFHGRDVRVLQQALNSLGFACGSTDGIFGAYTERALREFQRNIGQPVDGIAGPDAVSALMALRHVWEGKEAGPHSQARTGPARVAEHLPRIRLGVVGLDEAGAETARRVANLATATNPDAGIVLLERLDARRDGLVAVVAICAGGTASAIPGRPLVSAAEPELFGGRLLAALATARAECSDVVVELGGEGMARDEVNLQRAAVMLLDAVCEAFDRGQGAW